MTPTATVRSGLRWATTNETTEQTCRSDTAEQPRPKHALPGGSWRLHAGAGLCMYRPCMRKLLVVPLSTLLLIFVGWSAVAAASPSGLAARSTVKWSRNHIPRPSRAQKNSPFQNGISCPTASSCVVVGIYDLGGGSPAEGDSFAFADVERRGTWHRTTVPQPSDEATPQQGSSETLSVLDDVSCSSARFCAAIGAYQPQGANLSPLVELWNGRAWRVAVGVPTNELLGLTGISCTSARNCWASGDLSDESGGRSTAIAVHYNGHAWSTSTLPTPKRWDPDPGAIDCPTRSRCVITGEMFARAKGPHTASWFRTPGGWRFVRPVSPHDADHSPGGALLVFSDVACPTSRDCLVAGTYDVPDGRHHIAGKDLLERWNGHRWRRLHANSLSDSNQPNVIGCASGHYCIAAGNNVPGRNYVWNGHRWRSVNASGLRFQVINAIACSRHRRCAASLSSSLYVAASR
jgi:hypothetical protein